MEKIKNKTTVSNCFSFEGIFVSSDGYFTHRRVPFDVETS